MHVALSATVREPVASGQFGLGLAADEVDLSGVDHRVSGSFRAVCARPPRHPLSDRSSRELPDSELLLEMANRISQAPILNTD